MSTEHLEAEVPIFRCYYPARDGFAEVICRILADFQFRVPYANRRGDIRNLMHTIHSRFPRGRDLDENFQLAVLSE